MATGAASSSASVSAASATTAVELLDRFYAALPEAMGNTMCTEGDGLAAAARVGRARGLLGLFALGTAGVYQKPAAKSTKENQNGSANATGSGVYRILRSLPLSADSDSFGRLVCVGVFFLFIPFPENSHEIHELFYLLEICCWFM